VIVRGDTIESVATTAPAGIPVTELGGATLLPGLIDCHTHLSARVGIDAPERFRSTAARAAIAGVNNARATIMAGFTTVRDVGGTEKVDVGLRDAINAGEIVGPRMQAATWALSMTGGHGDPQNAVDYHGATTSSGVADGVDECGRKSASTSAGRRPHQILATGGVLSPHDNPSTPATRSKR
jgi:imidazolonepropionase-like amidohydrolase